MKTLAEYFSNSASVSSPVTLWEAYKAVLRGYIIQFPVKHKQERQKLQCDLEYRLESISATFKQSLTPANGKLLDQAHMELDLCVADNAERTLHWSHQKWYAKAIKSNATLANRLRTFTPKFTPITLRICHNILTSNPTRILDEFRHRLTTLYSAHN